MTVPGPQTRHGVLVAVLTALSGPAIGSLLVITGMLIRAALGGEFADDSWRALQGIAGMAGFVTIFGYVSGGIPALICGIYLGWYSARYGAISRVRAVAAAAAASIAGLAAMDAVMLLSGGGGSVMPLIVIVLPAAVLSALIGRAFIIRLGVIPAC